MACTRKSDFQQSLSVSLEVSWWQFCDLKAASFLKLLVFQASSPKIIQTILTLWRGLAFFSPLENGSQEV